MLQYFLKLLLSALIIVLASEISKRSTLLGALLVSLPLTSILAISWLYFETKDLEKVSELTTGILWLVIPSLVLFIALPFLIKQGLGFYLSLSLSCLATALAYLGTFEILKRVSN